MKKITLSESQISTLNKSRKRNLNILEWCDNQAKQSRQSGLPYTGRNGKHHSEVSTPLGERVCGSRCRLEGCWLLPERRLELFHDFWKGQSDNYSLTKSRVENLQKRIKSGELSFEDKRGLQSNPRKLTTERREVLLEHINSFPTYISHYCRANGDPERKYLDADMNITKMHKLYCEMIRAAIGNTTEPECLSTYRQVFLQTGLKIGLPKTDTCDKCDLLHRRLREISISNHTGIRELEAEIEAHHLKADSAYSNLRIDTQLAKASSDVVTLCIDMQQTNMLSPKISASDSYYRTKFSSFNVAISNPATDVSQMFFWHEVDGHRGQIEISSIIHKYVTENYARLEPEESRKLNFWSDKCVAQNNNYHNVALFKYFTLMGFFYRSQPEVLSDGSLIFAVRPPLCDFRDFQVLRFLIPKPDTLKVTQYHVITSYSSRPSVYLTKESHEGDNQAVHPIMNRENLSRNTVINLQFTSAYNTRFDVPERKVTDIRSLLRFLSSEERTEWTDLLPTLAQTQRPDPRPEAIADHSYSVQSLRVQEDHNYI
ncbi:unnamed protein product [Allacma fusca]|uniref:Uncharacterized protein n=1 Tax=Allacma fusca TaxID=39272 RepID=A0A8J2KQU9_9HEXA|nr:unnamed protein product [Allacma fusca]